MSYTDYQIWKQTHAERVDLSVVIPAYNEADASCRRSARWP